MIDYTPIIPQNVDACRRLEVAIVGEQSRSGCARAVACFDDPIAGRSGRSMPTAPRSYLPNSVYGIPPDLHAALQQPLRANVAS